MDLRTKKPAPAPALPTGPLPMGTVLSGYSPLTPEEAQALTTGAGAKRLAEAGTSRLTPMEAQLLQSAGWKPGDPIPSTIPDIVMAAQKAQALEAQTALPLAPDTPPLRMPTPTKMADLPPEQQQQIMADMITVKTQAQEAMQVAREFQKFQVPNAGPGINDAIRQALATSGQPQVPVVPTTTPAPTPATPAPNSPPEPLSLTGALPPRKCQHCGWPEDQPEPSADPGLEEKRRLLQALLGGIRYQKPYDLLGGEMRVTYRTLTTEEADLCFAQTAADTLQLPLTDDTDRIFMRTLIDYRLCLGIGSIQTRHGEVRLPEKLSDWQTDPPPRGQTKLVYILRYIYEHVFPVESARRAVGATFVNFQRMVELMEARVLDPDFWKATEELP